MFAGRRVRICLFMFMFVSWFGEQETLVILVRTGTGPSTRRCGARDGVEACGEVVGGRGRRAVWARRQEEPASGVLSPVRYGTAGEAR